MQIKGATLCRTSKNELNELRRLLKAAAKAKKKAESQNLIHHFIRHFSERKTNVIRHLLGVVRAMKMQLLWFISPFLRTGIISFCALSRH